MNKTLLTTVAALTVAFMGAGVCEQGKLPPKVEAIYKEMEEIERRNIEKLEMEALREEMRLLRHEIEDLNDFNILKLH